jgi:hypothetical protein
MSPPEEQALIETIKHLPFREFEFRGFLGKRRTVSFGWRYDFNVRELQEAEKIPTFLLSVRQKAARFASLAEARLQHVSSLNMRRARQSAGIGTDLSLKT